MDNQNESFNHKLLRKSIFWGAWTIIVAFLAGHIVDVLMIVAAIIHGDMTIWEVIKKLIKALFS